MILDGGPHMNRLLEKMLEKWISIPRVWRVGALTFVVLIFLFFFLIKGFSAALSQFVGISRSALAGALIVAFLLLLIFNKN